MTCKVHNLCLAPLPPNTPDITTDISSMNKTAEDFVDHMGASPKPRQSQCRCCRRFYSKPQTVPWLRPGPKGPKPKPYKTLDSKT